MPRTIELHNLLKALIVLLLASNLAEADDGSEHAHPLDPLSAQEITTTVELVKTRHGKPSDVLFPMVSLQEPTKDELAQYNAGKAIPRRGFTLVYDRKQDLLVEAVVDLKANKVLTWTEKPGKRALVTDEEDDEAKAIVSADKRWKEALRERGVENPDHVFLSVWAPGDVGGDVDDKSPLLRVIPYFCEKGEVNFYGRPIEGLVALVDLRQKRVVKLTTAQNVGFPKQSADFFDPKLRGPQRKGLKPLNTLQPQGPSFVKNGSQIRWQNWRIRYALHPREGLVLYDIGYEDGGRVRPILHRASLSEMVVPYGDPGATWDWRAAFDLGEYGIGWLANPLKRGEDVPRNAALFPAVFADDLGNVDLREDVIAIYERDGGLLWKHMDEREYHKDEARALTRRARELVFYFITTVGNYDYGLRWVFRQDGSIRVQADLTGILLAKAVDSNKCQICDQVTEASQDLNHKVTIVPSGDQRFGTLVSKGVVGVNHQHILSFRLDFAVDGRNNSFAEMNIRPYAGPGNPRANAFLQTETLFAKEYEARRNMNLNHHRTWKVFNPSQRTSLGHHPSYVLFPEENGVPYLGKDTPLRKRAAFMNHHVWVTRYHPRELYAAGDYPRQNPNQGGLSVWSGDESIDNQDLVLWYTLTVNHVPRPEEWPVMPTHEAGFRLLPSGFFTQNPALDLPD